MRAAALATALLAAALPALADRPLVSETADVIEDGTCQVEAWGGRSTASGSPAVRGLAGFFSCGVGSSTQLGLGASDERSDGITTRTLLVAGKTTLVAPADGRTGFGVAYSFDNVHVQGQGSKFDNVNVVGLVTRQIAPQALLHLNLGWNRSRATHLNSTTWSVGVETTTTHLRGRRLRRRPRPARHVRRRGLLDHARLQRQRRVRAAVGVARRAPVDAGREAGLLKRPTLP